MRKPRKFDVVGGGPLAELRMQVEDLIRQVRARELGPELAIRSTLQGARPVVLWLPRDDSDYRARLADQCGRLAQLTSDEEAMAAAAERGTAQTPGWR
jgi:hypothetical protein